MSPRSVLHHQQPQQQQPHASQHGQHSHGGTVSSAFPSAQSLRSLVSPTDRHLVDKLQTELDALRQSTRVALEKSWEEVEVLQTRVHEETQRGDRLALELEEGRKREDRWRRKYDNGVRRSEWMTHDDENRRAGFESHKNGGESNRSIRSGSSNNNGIGNGNGNNNGNGGSGNGASSNTNHQRDSDDAPTAATAAATATAEGNNNNGPLCRDESFKTRTSVAGNKILQSALNVFARGQSTPPQRDSSASGVVNTHGDCRNVDMLKSFKVSCEDWEKFLQSEEFAEEELAELHESWPSMSTTSGNERLRRNHSSTNETNEDHLQPQPQPQQQHQHQQQQQQLELQPFNDRRDDATAIVAERDATISALENRLSDRDRDMDSMRADLELIAVELERMRLTFQDKESSLLQQVDALDREVNRLKRKVKERDGIIAKQVEWSEDCQKYIRELTTELGELYKERDEQKEREGSRATT
uniref:Uncharacterized protein n=1 Tax=Odontella aurita TaxID=265563 RepID=A0A7S4NAB9_9STRA|mmetsp:Transcript_54555/g.162999  ORF Transcript_54555/g.162999 Transcript_54555/m.162999 type:complete len:472 (+) Transcript_54555:220-1635(+)